MTGLLSEIKRFQFSVVLELHQYVSGKTPPLSQKYLCVKVKSGTGSSLVISQEVDRLYWHFGMQYWRENSDEYLCTTLFLYMITFLKKNILQCPQGKVLIKISLNKSILLT